MIAAAIIAFRLWLAAYCPNGLMAPGPVFMPHSPAASRYVCWSVVDNNYLCSTVEAI